ncbi:MAG: hypothetical protein JNK76_24630 [Planctomycetales bacterium]|nr:hypothetical protein [Planctomycetales bacterium]MBN8626596.1 hypothetical protein [Planctomycetota bacterium]
MDQAPEPKRMRPYFLPETVAFDTLPRPVQVAFTTIVEPAYRELVLGAASALERSAGASFVFLLAEEVLNHFEIGRQMNLDQSQVAEDRAQREQALARHLKLLSAKNSALGALLRIRKLPSLFRVPPGGGIE